MSIQSSYKNIFKTTFLFGFVQVFNIVVKIILNKIIALLLGSQGIGTIGLFNNSINLLKTGGGLGISQSAVRDISEANADGNKSQFSKIISLVNKIIIHTAILGVILTVLLSPFLSQWTFGDKTYILSYLGVALVVGISIMTEGQLAILKGMRQLRALAKASMLGAVSGLLSAVPFYYLLGMKGIVPSLIITAVTSLFFSNYYVRKIKYTKMKISRANLRKDGQSMIGMGISLMIVSFVGFLSDLIVSSYINNNGGLGILGFYQAGITIISGYFGIILTAMTTDYYPRISAIHQNNKLLMEEVNKQSEIGLVLAFPLSVLFIFFSPFIITVLYSSEFIMTIRYTDFAVLGMLIIICSNNMGMILLAKQKPKIFLTTTIIQRIINISISIILYNYYGILGLGISYLILGVFHIILVSGVMGYFYGIKFKISLFRKLFFILIIAIISLLTKEINSYILRHTIGCVLSAISIFYSYYFLHKNIDFDIKKILKLKRK